MIGKERKSGKWRREKVGNDNDQLNTSHTLARALKLFTVSRAGFKMAASFYDVYS